MIDKEDILMKNIQLHPTQKIVLPNDRGTKLIFSDTPECYRKYMAGKMNLNVKELKKHPKYKGVKTPVYFSIDPAVVAADSSVTEILGQFDNDVANVCISEWEAGNRYVTYGTIYRTLTGKVGDSEANPSKDQLAKIKHSLKKLMNIQLEIRFHDAAEKLGYNNGKKRTVKNYIIPAQFVECTVNGQKTTVIELTEESPLLTVARMKNNQIISYDVELLNIPKQKNTPLNIELKHYAIRRVIETIAHPRQLTPSITFVDVLEKCRITDADNKKKHRVRETLKKVFEHLVNCGVIDSYQVNKKAGVFHSISFSFSDAKRPKEESNAAKEKPSTECPIKEKAEKQEGAKEESSPWALWAPGNMPSSWAMEISPLMHYQYRPYTLSTTPFNTAINAIIQFLKNARFFTF